MVEFVLVARFEEKPKGHHFEPPADKVEFAVKMKEEGKFVVITTTEEMPNKGESFKDFLMRIRKIYEKKMDTDKITLIAV